MTISNGNSGGMTSEINVTPMMDVLLVLLIIFMVIVPAMPRGEAAQVPQPSRPGLPISDGNPVVLEVFKGSDGQAAFKINQHAVTRQDLPSRLGAIYANHAARVLFVKGDDEVSFNQVAEAIDIGHAAGVDRVGLMTPGVLAGQ
jgi:biopolymer transport protein ExbD